jgi:hypothetical protein
MAAANQSWIHAQTTWNLACHLHHIDERLVIALDFADGVIVQKIARTIQNWPALVEVDSAKNMARVAENDVCPRARSRRSAKVGGNRFPHLQKSKRPVGAAPVVTAILQNHFSPYWVCLIRIEPGWPISPSTSMLTGRNILTISAFVVRCCDTFEVLISDTPGASARGNISWSER